MTSPRIVIAGLLSLLLLHPAVGQIASQVVNSVAVGSITGLGTGVATALGINVGSAGAPVVNGGALGTPSSGVATNLTSIPVANATGVLPAANGGAGTINGALKGNGSGTVSQAASTDLSDTTAEGAWTPTDQSGASLSFSSVAATFSKSNKTCVGQFRLTFPATANGNTITISLPCTLPNNSSNPAIGTCFSSVSGQLTLVALGLANTATVQFLNTVGSQPSNIALTTGTLSCNLAFNSQ